jgi:hypothetical protein
VFGPSDIYVVAGSVYKSTDTKNWTLVNLTDADRGFSLNGLLSGSSMFAFSEDDYWLTYGYIGHVTGTVRQKYSFGDTIGFLHAAWGTSSSDMYAVGDGGTILHFDGGSWTKMASGTTHNLSFVWGTSDQNIWACGYDDGTATSVLLHYDGTWHAVSLTALGIGPGAHVLNNVWCCDSSGHHITILGGSLVWRSIDGGPWRTDSSQLGNAYAGGFNSVAVIGNAANDFIAEGGYGFTLHWNGNSWKSYNDFLALGSNFGAESFSMAGNTVCLAGEKGGASWVAIGQR